MVASSAPSIADWWSRLCSGDGAKDKTKEEITLAAYTVWNVWKERNRRIFEQKALTAMALAGLIRDEVKTFYEANKVIHAVG